MHAPKILTHPFIIFVVSFVTMWIAARIGFMLHNGPWKLKKEEREDFNIILGGSLTLLGLIIGFSFSMAISRYDLRKIYEESEANAIGTEYVRASLLPAADAAKVRMLLRSYLDQRVLFFEVRDERQLQQIYDTTGQMQAELWSAVQVPALAQPTPISALAVSGMNDVLNAQGYTQSAYWNRIPIAAWGLMGLLALSCNLLIGFASLSDQAKSALFIILPLFVSIAFLLIADLDSPRGGIIRVAPYNLTSLYGAMH